SLDPRPTNLATFRMLIGVPLFAECELAIHCVTVPLFAECELAIHCVTLTTPVNGENNKANDTTDDKQHNCSTGIDVHAATKQDEDQADGQESQQAPKATLEERRAFIIAHGSPNRSSIVPHWASRLWFVLRCWPLVWSRAEYVVARLPRRQV